MVIRTRFFGGGDKNSLFRWQRIAKMDLGVKGNVTTGYCGRDKGPEYGGLDAGHGRAW